mmetsp:Transcript_16746/g.14669  ORF Transcript_16746/g.14669 Transcript_16746/m.14669 type:complete len:103 (+) Transcript_16746:164-472(+)
MGCRLSPIFKESRATITKGFQHFEDYQEENLKQTPTEERNSFLLLFCVGIFSSLATILLTSSISHIPVTESQVIFGTKAFFVLILSIFILKSKFSYYDFIPI